MIAVAAIAEELSNIGIDTYLAGIWKIDVIRQPLWKRQGYRPCNGGGVEVSRPKALCSHLGLVGSCISLFWR
jgi:hypothetical protein